MSLPSPTQPGLAWILKMAWRDSRGQRKLLLLYTLSIVFGLGALVSINAFRDNLSNAIDEQSQELLGADLSFTARQAFSPQMEAFIFDLKGQQAREVQFRSMAYFPGPDATRLVDTRALEDGFPFYGEFETEPLGIDFRDAQTPKAIIEQSLMLQYGLEPGDTLRLGQQEFTIAGALLRVAGESEIASVFAPRIYIDRAHLDATELIQFGSIATHKVYFKFPNGYTEDIRATVEASDRGGLLATENISFDTVENRQRNIQRVMNNISDFLNLVGFIALLLGGIGVAGAVQVYLKEKLGSIALMRCLGVRARTCFAIYLTQVLAAGMIGAAVGSAIGVGVQFLLPSLIQNLVPFAVEVSFSPQSVLISLAFGAAATGLFALLPLLSIRKVSPLKAIRASIEIGHPLIKDPYAWLIGLSIAGGVLWFALEQTRRPIIGLGYFGGLAISLGVLALLAYALRALLKRSSFAGLPYVWRLSLSNLYRPQNRTLFLLVTLGMGAFLIHTLYLSRDVLLQRVAVSETGEDPNLILVDIQPDQVDGVKARVTELGFTSDPPVPIVTMRTLELKGRPIAEWRRMDREEGDGGVEDWVYTWEFRVTYRDQLLANESIVGGEWVPEWDGFKEPVPISMTPNIAEAFKMELGDTLTWNIQGIPLQTELTSLREVDWSASRLNFGVVFPIGVLEEAPQFFGIMTQTPDRNESARLQQELVVDYPNISAVDLSLVFENLNSILNRISFVIQFMAAFTLATGLVVLAGAIVTSRYQRVRESVLLRTLGAAGQFVRGSMAIEYALMGALGGATGIVLSYGAGWALARYVFSIPDPSLNPLSGLLAIGIIAVITLLTGLFNSRGIASHPPLAILREEG